jgi:hypothetical protein
LNFEQKKPDEKEKKYPGYDLMSSFSLRTPKTSRAPDPKSCIIEMINLQLRTLPEGRKIVFNVSKQKTKGLLSILPTLKS